jgi:hypothetical protein
MQLQDFPFYEEHDGILSPDESRANPLRGVGLLALSGVRGHGVVSEDFISLRYKNAVGCFNVTVHFHTLYGFYRTPGENRPVQSMTLNLRGTTGARESIFARVEIPDLNDPQKCVASFSPVPFGQNGKPIFPSKRILRIAAGLVLEESPNREPWGEGRMTRALNQYDKSVFSSVELLGILKDLRVCEYSQNQGWLRFMSPADFEKVFGLTMKDLR